MNIAFCMLNARHPPSLIGRLADRLAPHRLFLHQDYSQFPTFMLPDSRVTLVEAPRVTRWGEWSITEAILHSIEFCLRECRFEYLQMLTPACLPVRPMADFEWHVARSRSVFHCDLIDLLDDDNALMTYAPRFLAPGGSFGLRALMRARRGWFGPRPLWHQRAGLVVLEPRRPMPLEAPLAALAEPMCEAVRRRWLALLRARVRAIPLFADGTRPMAGSTWFGATRAGCEYLVQATREPRVREYFSNRHISDELLVPTLAGNSGLPVGPSNHFVSPFDVDGHPTEIQAGDLPAIRASGKFFARKFPVDPAAPACRALAQHLDGAGEAAVIAR